MLFSNTLRRARWRLSKSLAAAALAAAGLSPSLAAQPANACACGCGVFDVGTANLLPEGAGDTIYAQSSYMDQVQNFSGDSKAPAADNDDKRIRSDFLQLGWQHMFNRDWGVMVDVPVTDRLYVADTGSRVQTFRHTAFGDVKITGVYSGFSQDMSTGLIFGVKLPTGDWKFSGFDRDVSIGSGSTDLIVGGYHQGKLGKTAQTGWFVQAVYQAPVAIQGGYRPGGEADAAAGVYWEGWTFDNGLRLSPVAQVIASSRAHDHGPEADPDNSGYQRVMVSPGLELNAKRWRLYGDVELPVYQRVSGNQLVAPALMKLTLSRSF
ncbi:MAG TPA: hypothetical protein VG407_08635 [Caulobacteraceae bacterium]|jgi:hypothetical protein|nr:hypothetical protein [Caulobacteraceae bacterium]